MKPTPGLRALLQDTHRLLSPSAPSHTFGQPSPQLGANQPKECSFDKTLLKIENILCDLELQLPKDYSDTIKKFIEVIRKDVKGAKR